MEYMGQTQTATYMTGPKLGSATTSQFLPAIGSMQSSYKAFDTYPAPSPLRRSHTTLPWRPSTYYGVAKVNPTVTFLLSLIVFLFHWASENIYSTIISWLISVLEFGRNYMNVVFLE